MTFNFDITCGAAQAMCEVYRNVCTTRDDALQVNLLYSFAGPDVSVRSHLTERGRLEIETSVS